MSKRFIEITSGWIPVSVLLLFTAALVTGQAQANLPDEAKSSSMPAAAASFNFVLNKDTLRNVEAVPLVIDSILALPSEFELSIEARILSGKDDASGRSKLSGK